MFNNELWQKPAGGAGGAGFYTHQIANSVRVSNSSANSTATNYLYRDGGASNRDTWTIGMWIKRARIATSDSNTSMATWGGHSGSGDGRSYGMVSDYTGTVAGMSFEDHNGSSWHLTTRTSAVYRDLSAWTHVCWRYDSTQGTDTNRARMYVNGELITALQATTYPAENADASWNGGGYQFIGTNGTGTNGNNPYQGFDGYIAEVVAIDGTSLDPMDNLLETKNGVIIPKDPSGLTFGSEGFYLKFESSSDLGNDSSGNNNDFTVAGIAAHDQMLDSPTFGSEGSANFPTINVLDPTVTTSAISEGNLKITEGNGLGGKATFAVPLTGKWYWEAYCYCDSAQEMWNGITGITADSSGDSRGGSSNSNTYGASWSNYSGSNMYIRKYIAGSESAESGSFGTTKYTILGIAINRDDDEAKFYKDNALQFTTSISATQEYFPAGGMGGGTNATTIQVWNFGQDGTFAGEKTAQGNADGNGYGNFFYAPPTDHLALNSANLPTAAEIDPAETDDDYPQELFQPFIWTGDGNTTRSFTLNFKPDFSWAKQRSHTYQHIMYDTNRTYATLQALGSNGTWAEGGGGDNATNGYFSSSDSSGFSVNRGTATSAGGSLTNSSSTTFASWHWRANGGTTSTNSTGSHDATQQVDPSGAFSISTMADTSATSVTVGHGLSAAPSMYIVKSYSGASTWGIYHKSLGATKNLNLNTTAGEGTSSSYFNDTEPTSSVLSLGASWNGAGTLVVYAFADIEGYCKAGAYTGNGDADGPFVYTGFRPALVTTKRATVSTGGYLVHDNVRDTYNPSKEILQWNADGAEFNGANDRVDFLANGFKVRSSNGGINADGSVYVYIAMAHNPFKYATAR